MKATTSILCFEEQVAARWEMRSIIIAYFLAFHSAPKEQKIGHPTQTPRIGTSFWIPIRSVFQATFTEPL